MSIFRRSLSAIPGFDKKEPLPVASAGLTTGTAIENNAAKAIKSDHA
jgi:hypothetical protein